MAIDDYVTDDLTADITAISLHNGDPGTTGANEISGNGYARLAPSFSAASSGMSDLTAALEFDGPASQQVTHYGAWSGATFLYGRPLLGAPLNFNPSGRLDLNSAPINTTTSS